MNKKILKERFDKAVLFLENREDLSIGTEAYEKFLEEMNSNADKTIKVRNQCLNKEGKLDVSEGVAYPQNDGNSQLKVSFLPKGLRWVPFSKGDYWVLRVDENYQVALVGGPSHRYLWLLSRTPDMDEAVIEDYLNTAKAQGYDLSKLIRTKHTTVK